MGWIGLARAFVGREVGHRVISGCPGIMGDFLVMVGLLLS